MILDDPYQEPTPEQIEKMREWYDRIVVPRLGTEFFFASGGQMAMTKGEFPKPLHDDMVDAFSYAFNARRELVYDWKMIRGFIFYNLMIILSYVYAPSTRVFLFFLMLGTSSSFIFRPFIKRWRDKKKPYTIDDGEFIPYTEPPESMRGLKFEKEYVNDPTTIHNERIDG